MSRPTLMDSNTAAARIGCSPRLLRIAEVCDRTTLSRATVYREEAAGRFPNRVRLTECAVAWREADVIAWIETRQPVEQAA